ncbi:MAG: DsbE family thiol:disulfide interchange protein [Hyphomicrobiales bacterium]|nr:DsbE family thiol:disulfide interchange protein [Hyphomicrobiales bacterium]MDE2016869.1 DsbE family thiol:disulfide interchange protein [Hyphomicrobiales bacterium]
MDASTEDAARRTGVSRRLFAVAPLGIVAATGALLYSRLGAGDPSVVPSALIGKPAPAFDMKGLGAADAAGFATRDLAQGHVTLVNFFASWCVECHDEHDTLMRLSFDAGLAKMGVRMFGVAYKDKPADAAKFLADNGNPFTRVGLDPDGMAGVGFGVYGVPETYVVSGAGTIRHKFIGPILGADAMARVVGVARKALTA